MQLTALVVIELLTPRFRQLANECGHAYTEIQPTPRLLQLFKDDKYKAIERRALELIDKMPKKEDMVF